MSSAFLFYIVVALVCIGMGTVIKWIHTAPERWKSTASLIFTIISIFVAFVLYEFGKYTRAIPNITVVPDTTIFVQALENVTDSIKESENRLMDSHVELQNLLRALPDTSVSASMRDSLLAKIELLDKHIDRHFYRLARFSDIDK